MTDEQIIDEVPITTRPKASRLVSAFASSDGTLHKSLLSALESDLESLLVELLEDIDSTVAGGSKMQFASLLASLMLQQPFRGNLEAILKELH